MTVSPNFILAGAAKAGTTAICQSLNDHPSIFFPIIKEPNYFSTDIDVKNFRSTYRKSVKVYDSELDPVPTQPVHSAFVRNEQFYHSLYDHIEPVPLTGDASTTYLYSSQAARNIYKHNPESKILIVIRQPIYRAYSHFLMDKRMGFVSGSFWDAISEDIRQTEKGWGISNLYIELGLYAKQILRFLDLFPVENVKIMLHDQLTQNPEAFYQDIYSFLGVQSHGVVSNKRLNESKSPRFSVIHAFLAKTGLLNVARNYFSTDIRQKIKSIYLSKQPTPALSEDDFNKLLPYFEGDLNELESVLQLDLNEWRKFTTTSPK